MNSFLFIGEVASLSAGFAPIRWSNKRNSSSHLHKGKEQHGTEAATVRGDALLSLGEPSKLVAPR